MFHNDLVNFLVSSRTVVHDQTALSCAELYNEWDSFDEGYKFAVGDRVNCDSVLWKCITEHEKQESWRPSVSTASLWTAINEKSKGTIDDPIEIPEALTSFEYEWGFYYVENGALYLCDRQGGKEGEKYVLNYKPSQLVGHYFSLAEGGEV